MTTTTCTWIMAGGAMRMTEELCGAPAVAVGRGAPEFVVCDRHLREAREEGVELAFDRLPANPDQRGASR
jgi:hypothetical protein